MGLVLVLAGSCTTTTGDTDPISPAPTSDLSLGGSQVAVIDVDGQRLEVAVADTAAQRSQGLRGVNDLGDLDGMLFVFESERVALFTMEDTLIPLDIWFIDRAGAIVATLEMEPCVNDPCPSFPSGVEVSAALETARGAFEFDLGDTVSNIASP